MIFPLALICAVATGHVVLVGQGNEPREAFPHHGQCEGHCSTDSDCDAGSNLRCFRRPSAAAAAATESDIPGCTGMGDLESNYCSAVTYLPGHLTMVQKGLQLSQGLACRVIATSGQKVQYDTNDGDGRSYSRTVFHKLPDGAVVFADETTGGWMYVSNSEGDDWSGGVGGIRFDRQGRVIGYKRLLSGRRRNCGGGKTYWNTFLSCEEVVGGQVFEIDPFGKKSNPRQTIMGGNEGAAYESAAYDSRNPNDPKFFLTVDRIDGALVRFLPDADAVQYAVQTGDYSQLLHTNGTSSRRDYLILTYTNNNNDTAANTTMYGTFAWTTDIDEAKLNAQSFYRESEGLDVRNGRLYMTTKRDKLLFILDLDKFTFESSSTKSGAFSKQPDQIRGILQDEENENFDPDILYFCEDGASHAGVHGRDSNGKFYTILTTETIPGESSGLAFSPNNRFMYVSYQEAGMIYEIRRTDGFPFGGQRLDIKYHEG